MISYPQKSSIKARTIGKSCQRYHKVLQLVDALCCSSPSFVQVSGRTCHRSFQTFISSSTLLDQGSLVPTVHNMLEGIPYQ